MAKHVIKKIVKKMGKSMRKPKKRKTSNGRKGASSSY